MGPYLNKDENIDIYFITLKDYYVAGEYVDGEIYLNVKKTSPYIKLTLGLKGKERVSWTQKVQDETKTIKAEHINYNVVMDMFDFGTMVKEGQYCFPFSFLLPSTMTGTILYSSDCNIKYSLKASLVDPTN
jgi:hypothetical protein